MFDRFRQADSTTTRVHGGLGLGLSIARQLVEMHGGTIRAASEGRGKGGATFTSSCRPPRAASLAAQPASADAALPSLDGVHVLAVDDQEDARALLQAVLRGAGAEVDLAASADEARQRIRAASGDCHLRHRDAGGRRLRPDRDIRQADGPGRHRLPCIAVTAYAREDDRPARSPPATTATSPSRWILRSCSAGRRFRRAWLEADSSQPLPTIRLRRTSKQE